MSDAAHLEFAGSDLPTPHTGARGAIPEPLARRHRIVPLSTETADTLVVPTADTAATVDQVDDIGESSEEAGAVIRLAEQIIHDALVGAASDIHVEPGKASSRVRYRIDGVLHEVMTLPRKVHAPLVSRLKLIAFLDIAERRRPQDGRSTYRSRSEEPTSASGRCRSCTAGITSLEYVESAPPPDLFAPIDPSDLDALPDLDDDLDGSLGPGEHLPLTLATPPADQGTYAVLRDPLGSELVVDRPVLRARRADVEGAGPDGDRARDGDVAPFERLLEDVD